uniref:Uncharacterized protein n=1 Tax=Anopheles maculatus TaxID=74869 RepID=A0A182SD96_9DIPT
MRIIHGINFEPELIREYQHVIYQNIVKGMQVLCDARDKLDIPWEHPTSQLAANEAVMFHSGCLLDAEQFHQYVPIINILWTDGAIRKAYDRRREFQIVSPLGIVPIPLCCPRTKNPPAPPANEEESHVPGFVCRSIKMDNYGPLNLRGLKNCQHTQDSWQKKRESYVCNRAVLRARVCFVAKKKWLRHTHMLL